MKKIPTIFERDWDGDRSRVLDQPVEEAAWVFAGEGVATQKLDGTCCLVARGSSFNLEDGAASRTATQQQRVALYKRHEVRPGKEAPAGFQAVAQDLPTGKVVGWVPVGDGPEDQWHREAFMRGGSDLAEGTYELIGPKVQGGPEGVTQHELVRHVDLPEIADVPRTFDGLRAFFTAAPHIEGIVWHHPDGRMAKIKLRDFGIKRAKVATPA